MGEWRYSFIYS